MAADAALVSWLLYYTPLGYQLAVCEDRIGWLAWRAFYRRFNTPLITQWVVGD